jgi:hypothetical protein
MGPFLPGVGPLEDRPTTLRPSPTRHRMAGPWPSTAQLAWWPQARGIRREALGFNPNPPAPFSLVLQLLLETSVGSPPYRLLCLGEPHRPSVPAPLPSSPLHHRPHPLPHGPQGR